MIAHSDLHLQPMAQLNPACLALSMELIPLKGCLPWVMRLGFSSTEGGFACTATFAVCC